MKQKIKILIITNAIMHYRVSLYNELAKKYELKIIYSDGMVPDDLKCEIQKIEIIKIWKLKFYKESLRKNSVGFDAIIAVMDISRISIIVLPFLNIKSKIIFWGMGVSGSTKRKYDYSRFQSWIQKKLLKKVDAAIFYSNYPKDKYSQLGIDSCKLFVAPNTVKVPLIDFCEYDKNYYLFVGRLYESKKVLDLLESYQIALSINDTLPKLVIVGDGDEREFLEKWTLSNNLHLKVQFLGEVLDENQLTELYKKAIVSLSIGQAGLSVQRAMGYGVPFVTLADAYTGGEIFDIIHNVNGLILKKICYLPPVLIDIACRKERYIKMGENAFKFYWGNRTQEIMIDNFSASIDFVLDRTYIP